MVWHINVLKALINVPNQTLFIEIWNLTQQFLGEKKKPSVITQIVAFRLLKSRSNLRTLKLSENLLGVNDSS